MKRARLVGEELCRTFTTNNLIIETNNTMPTMDIETERQLMELKRKMAEVRIEITLVLNDFLKIFIKIYPRDHTLFKIQTLSRNTLPIVRLCTILISIDS